MSEKKKDNPSRYVLRSECTQMMGEQNKKLDTIMKALVGEDLQGGLVKVVTGIQGELKNKATKDDIQQLQKKRKLSGRDIALILTAVVTTFGSIVVTIITYLQP